MIEKKQCSNKTSAKSEVWKEIYDNSEKLKFVFTSFLMRKIFTSFEVSSFLARSFSIDNIVVEVAQPFIEQAWCFVMSSNFENDR